MHRFINNIFALRRRYIFTRDGRVRMRYIAACIAVLLITPIILIKPISHAVSSMAVPYSISNLARIDLWEDENSVRLARHGSKGTPVSVGMRKIAKAAQKTKLPLYKALEVNQGQTLAGILQKQGVSGKDAYFAINALSEHYDVRKVRPGQKFDVYFKRDDDGEGRLFTRMEMKLSPVQNIKISKTDKDEFKVDLEEKELLKRTYARSILVSSSLYGSAARSDVPDKVVANLAKLYSWSMNLKRDIRKGDRIDVMYETNETADGSYLRTGNILYANIVSRNKEYPVYRFTKANGSTNYYRENGYTLKQGLLRQPVSGRVTSGYGMRRHPILGYRKMHTGIDFGAPTGTPIKAAANGRVDYIGRRGGYGKYISIRHNNKLQTAYAHLSRYKKGLKKGTRVKQGDIIGYVGSTGRSTGPHLHYEVKVNGRHINPRSKKVPTGEQLHGKDMTRFKTAKASLHKRYASLSGAVKLAGSIPHKPDNLQ
jgi:murein DD-endopeptidase MepM/ murein hydrolase activator NlpD